MLITYQVLGLPTNVTVGADGGTSGYKMTNKAVSLPYATRDSSCGRRRASLKSQTSDFASLCIDQVNGHPSR